MWDDAFVAYHADDKESLQQILEKNCQNSEAVETSMPFRPMAERKQGLWLDTVDIRMGGLLQRIKRAESRIEDYLAGHLTASMK